MIRIVAIAFGLSFAALALAQNAKKWEPPPTPEGWKAVVSKDGRYRFVVPKDVKSSGTRQLTSTRRGLKVAIQVNYFTLKDGTVLEVRGSTLTGTALKGTTVDQVLDEFIALDKKSGYTVSASKEIKIGDIKAREYKLSNGKQSQRRVVFGVKPRIFELEAASTDAAKLDTETVNTFLKSLVVVPNEVVAAAAKERTAKQGVTDKANLEKLGAKWTANLKEMKAPDAPAVGMIRGREFKPDSVRLDPGGWLVFQQGAKARPDVKVDVTLFLQGNESLENKSYEVGRGVMPPLSPHIRIATLPKGARLLKVEPFVNNYSLKLSFGAKDKDGAIPGTIYLCTPDAARSWLAGKFTVKEK